MTLFDAVVVGAGGFLGALIRFFLSRRFNKAASIPLGTLTVNLTGSLLIGFVIGIDLPPLWMYFLVSGFAGALTTFSTLNKELLQLWKENKKKDFFSYLLVTYSIGILFGVLGYLAGIAV